MSVPANRALDYLEALAEGAARVEELAARSGCTERQARRAVDLARAAGLVRFDEEVGGYVLTTAGTRARERLGR